MQLILGTETTLDIQKDMSSVEDIHNEKVVNGDIENLNKKNCNGNKENIEDINVIANDENKQVTNEVDNALANVPVDIKSEKKDVQSSNVEEAIKEKNSEVNANDAQIEESQSKDLVEDINSIRVVKEATENNPKEIVQDDFAEDEEDIISIKVENLNQILDIVEKETDDAVAENVDVEDVAEKNVAVHNVVAENVAVENVNAKNVTVENSVAENVAVENVVMENVAVGDVVAKTVAVENVDSENVAVEDVVTKNVVVENVDTENVAVEDFVANNIAVENIVAENVAVEKDVAEDIAVENVAGNDAVEDVVTENVAVEDVVAENVAMENIIVEKKLKKATVENTLSKNVVAENDRTTHEEGLLNTKDDVEVIEESTKTPVNCGITSDVLLETTNETESSEMNKDKKSNDKIESEKPNCDSTDVILNNDVQDSPIELKDDMDVEEVFEEIKTNKQVSTSQTKDTAPVNIVMDKSIICKLSNTLDILSDDEEELPKEEPSKVVDSNEKHCINIEDDDDIMLIDEDTSKTETPKTIDISNKEPLNASNKPDSEIGKKNDEELNDIFDQKDPTPPEEIKDLTSSQINVSEKQEETHIDNVEREIPLLPENFLKTAKKNISDMTREDLEEFCILKIVESIVDRSNLSEIKNKLKTMAQGIEEYRKKAMMLTKQNRDLQVVLKSIQEEQKKKSPDTPITPLKITRSVGMQVFMEKPGVRRKSLAQLNNSTNNNVTNKQNVRNMSAQSPRLQKPSGNQPIPVPRLVPANNPAMKTPSTVPQVNQMPANKTASPMPNGIKNPSPPQKVAEKRQHNRIMSVTVDLTDDEPPAKMNNRTSPAPPVRLVSPQNLLAAPRQPFATSVSSPRKVYIPISGPQNPAIRPGQTIMLKTVPTPGLRQRCPAPQVTRLPSGAVRMNRVQTGRHPAPLPDAMKQYQPPNWKALPPAPDLKLSKVENGIVISWKIEGYLEDSYEEIASYQLYAYQETSSPPSTTLWKKIGDVKALPLPMACTLTQFMAGFKYYFAVRAVDIRSRLGPFSLPGSILLLNKL